MGLLITGWYFTSEQFCVVMLHSVHFISLENISLDQLLSAEVG